MGHPYRMSYRSPWWLLRLRLSSLSAVAPLLYTERVPQKAFRVVSAGAFGAETKTLGRRKAYRRCLQMKYTQKARLVAPWVLGHWAISAETPPWGIPCGGHCGGEMVCPPASKVLDCLPLASFWKPIW